MIERMILARSQSRNRERAGNSSTIARCRTRFTSARRFHTGWITWAGKLISDVAGLAFGAGLDWKVQEAYCFLMNLWEPGDRVFLLGFSRGAYTVGVLGETTSAAFPCISWGCGIWFLQSVGFGTRRSILSRPIIRAFRSFATRFRSTSVAGFSGKISSSSPCRIRFRSPRFRI